MAPFKKKNSYDSKIFYAEGLQVIGKSREFAKRSCVFRPEAKKGVSKTFWRKEDAFNKHFIHFSTIFPVHRGQIPLLYEESWPHFVYKEKTMATCIFSFPYNVLPLSHHLRTSFYFECKSLQPRVWTSLKFGCQIDGWVQHYPKCLYKVKALRIVLHTSIEI